MSKEREQNEQKERFRRARPCILNDCITARKRGLTCESKLLGLSNRTPRIYYLSIFSRKRER